MRPAGDSGARRPGEGTGVQHSLVQVTLLPLVVSHDPEELDVLAQEAGRDEAVDPKLQPLLKRKGHALGRAGETRMHVRECAGNPEQRRFYPQTRQQR